MFGTEKWLTLELETQANVLACAAPQIKSPSAGNSRKSRPSGSSLPAGRGLGPRAPAEPECSAAARAGEFSGADASLHSARWSPGVPAFPVRYPASAPADMSGFSPELIDYLEGKISFEEFERRREERKTREKKVSRWAPRSGFPEAAGVRSLGWAGDSGWFLLSQKLRVSSRTPELSASQDIPQLTSWPRWAPASRLLSVVR